MSDAHLLQPLLEHARKTPDKTLFSRRVGDKFEPLTAADIVRTVRRLARGLIALGIEPGQRIALMSKTRVEWVLLDYFTFIVHVFLPAQRTFYALERLWGGAEPIEVSAS